MGGLVRPVIWLRAGFVVAIALTSAMPALASPQSRALIAQGRADMDAKHFDAALAKFQAAEKADPKDGDAFFFDGATENRLARPLLALPALRRAAVLHSQHPDLGFETGWAAEELGFEDQAIKLLERYESQHPGRAQTSEFLGRAYLQLKQYDKAEAKLNEAMARDPATRPTALFYLAGLQAARGNPTAANDQLQQMLQEAPESPLSRTLREQLAQSVPAPGKPWHVTLSTGIGYNSNAVALGTAQALPTDVARKGSAFSQTTLDAGYDFAVSQTDVISVGYGLNAMIYDRLSKFNALDNVFRVDGRHAFRPDLYGTFRISDEYTLVGGTNFRNQVDLRPALAYRINDMVAIEGAYDAGFDAYYYPYAVPQQDHSGMSHTFAATGFFTMPDTDWRAQLGVFHINNNASGQDFVYQSNGILAGVSHPLVWGVTAAAQISFNHDRYSNANSLSGSGTGPNGGAYRRADDVTHLTLQLQRPLFQTLGGTVGIYARYEYLNNYSNIQFFSFNQNIVSAGLTASF